MNYDLIELNMYTVTANRILSNTFKSYESKTITTFKYYYVDDYLKWWFKNTYAYYFNQKVKFEKQHGSYKSWHGNGNKCVQCTYIDGKRHGLYKTWHISGQLHEKINYNHGKIHGLYQCWIGYVPVYPEVCSFTRSDEEMPDKLYLICHYVNGKRHGLSERWYGEERELHEKVNYINGKAHGLCKVKKNGKLSEKWNYVNGKFHGLYECWYENGQVHFKCYYIHGKRQPAFEIWSENNK